MGKFIITAMIEIEVEADNEKQAFQKSFSKLETDFISCSIKSVEEIEED